MERKSNFRTNEGYVIIKSENYNGEYEIVLAVNKNKFYVTWESKIDKNDYFWGHYFNDYKHALIDYHQRLIDRYKEIPF